jgi:hypothetical protein
VRVAVDGNADDYQLDTTGQSLVTLMWQLIAFLFVAGGTTETRSRSQA